MKQLDYIVVGLGIAGISFCEQLRKAGRSFLVLDGGAPSATSVAAGTVNPVVLKHFTPVWNGAHFLETARAFYQQLEADLGLSLLEDRNLARVMTSEAEQKTWIKAAKKDTLKGFLDPEFKTSSTAVDAPFGLGLVKQSFRLDPQALRVGFIDWLETQGLLIREAFQHELLQQTEQGWTYKDLATRHVVFAEGVGVANNPFFTIDALIPKKGAYMIVEAPELQLELPIKARFFVIPLGADRYKVGATFVHGDETYQPTEYSRKLVEASLDKLLRVPYTIVDHLVGMRPTVKDRRPLLGRIESSGPYFLNGLGTRGLLMAPSLSAQLLQHIEKGTPLTLEMDINRFV